MALSIQQILTNAELREYLVVVANGSGNAFKGGAISEQWQQLIDAVRQGVQYRYTLSPTDPTLVQTSNFLFQITAPLINIAKVLQPTILSALTVSANEIDLEWTAVANGVTYTLQRSIDPTFNSGVVTVFSGSGLFFPDTGLTASTQYFYRIQVSAPGYTSSPYSYANATTLPAVVPITIYFWYGPSSPYAALQAGTDGLSYQFNENITHNSPISIAMPSGASPLQFLVVKVPIGESVKSTWMNGPFNGGSFPDANWEAPLQPAGLPNNTYYVSRLSLSLDTTQPLTLS